MRRATVPPATIAGLAAALTLLLALAPAAAEPSAAGAADLEPAREAFEAGRPVEALAAARRAAAGAPTARAPLVAHAAIAEFVGELDEAATVYARLETLFPDDLAVIYRRAAFAVRVGDYDAGLALLDRLLDAHPPHVRWLFRWAPGTVQPVLFRVAPSLEHLVQIKVDVLLEKGALDEARRLARAYRLVEPGRDYCGEARTTMRGTDREATFQAFRRATLAQPDAADCIWWYGQWLTDEGYVRLGRLMVAEGTRTTRSAASKEAGARYLRIRLGGQRDVPKRAEQLLQIARQRLLRDGDADGARRLLERAVTLAPDFVRPHAYLARIAWDDGDRATALGWLEHAVEADPESWRSHRNLGRMLAALDRHPEAEGHLRRTVALFGDDVGARLALARALYAQDRLDEYVEQTRDAVRLAAVWKHDLSDVRDFLARFEKWGPAATLPPAPDPQLILGWNDD